MLERTKAVFDALTKARSVSNVVGDTLEDIRTEIEDFKGKRDEIDALPVDRATAEARAIRFMQHEIERARERVPSPFHFTLSTAQWNEAYTPVPDFGALVLAYLGNQLIDAIVQDVAASYEDGPGVTDTERKKLAGENDRQLLDAELAEEAIIRHAETQGFAVDRRIEADPRAVLAADEALP